MRIVNFLASIVFCTHEALVSVLNAFTCIYDKRDSDEAAQTS